MTLEQIQTLRNHFANLGCTAAQIEKHLANHRPKPVTRRRIKTAPKPSKNIYSKNGPPIR